MTLFGVDIKAIVLGNLAGQLRPVTLHKRTQTVGEYGETVSSDTNSAGEGVRLMWKTEIAHARGYPMDAVKILLLQNGIPEPTKDDHVSIGGERFRIIDIEKDPVDATWSLAGVKV